MTCGQSKSISGGTTLVCTLDAHVHGQHALVSNGLVVARWPVPWTVDDERARVARLDWHKPHVRRAYIAPSQAAAHVPAVRS